MPKNSPEELERIEDVLNSLRSALSHPYVSDRPVHQACVLLCDWERDGIGSIELDDLKLFVDFVSSVLGEFPSLVQNG